MKIYTVIESLNIDVVGVYTFNDYDAACTVFDTIAYDNGDDIIDAENWPTVVPATLHRFAGDDVHAVELHRTEV